MEVEISCIKKIWGIFELLISIILISIIIIITARVPIIMIFMILIVLGISIYSLRIRNKKLYFHNRSGAYFPFFKESAIRITNEYITVKIREEPSFFIWWKDFDAIKINKKPKKWKIIQKLNAKRYKIQFYSIYPDYSKNFKFISSFELNTTHFSIQKCNEIIKNLQIFSNNLNKKLIIEG